MLFLPVLAMYSLLNMPEGKYWTVRFLEYDLIFGRVDRLSMVFGYIFTLITFIGIIFALHVKDNTQHVAAFIYAGSALGITFAGDLFTLYLFWEIMAISAVFLIWARKTDAAISAGWRYLLFHIVGGLCLLAGTILYVAETGSPEFDYIGLGTYGLASYLIFNSPSPLASGCLSRGDGYRCRVSERPYHKKCRIYFGQNLSGHYCFDLDRCDHDLFSHLLCGDRK
jgi:multicomponent Na+:H+ antiporter subunit D